MDEAARYWPTLPGFDPMNYVEATLDGFVYVEAMRAAHDEFAVRLLAGDDLKQAADAGWSLGMDVQSELIGVEMDEHPEWYLDDDDGR